MFALASHTPSCARHLQRSFAAPRAAGIARTLYQSLDASRQQQKQLPHPRATAAASMSSDAAAATPSLALDAVEVVNPDGLNFVLGHAHFIRTIDDVCNVFVAAGAGVRFGVAFNEASGDPSPGASPFPGRRVRSDGNDDRLIELARSNAMRIGAGHSFIAFMDGGGVFPIAVLGAIKALPTVCRVHCATANPTAVIVARLGDERKGILGVLDGLTPVAHEDDRDRAKRRDFLRLIGYKS